MASFDKEKLRLGSSPRVSILTKSMSLKVKKESLIRMKTLRVHSLGVHFFFSSFPQESLCSRCFSQAAGGRILLKRQYLEKPQRLHLPPNTFFMISLWCPSRMTLGLVVSGSCFTSQDSEWVSGVKISKLELGLPSCRKDGNWELRAVGEHCHYGH